MLNYHISPRELMDMAPETVETLFAGLEWWKIVKLSTPNDEGSAQRDAWDRLRGVIKSGG